MIKTQDEIECQKIATMITKAGFQAFLDHLKPGAKECELLAVAWQKFTELGSEWSQCANIVCSGPYTAPYRRFTSDRAIREGDMVIVDIGACFNGYWGDFTRTYVAGMFGLPKNRSSCIRRVTTPCSMPAPRRRCGRRTGTSANT